MFMNIVKHKDIFGEIHIVSLHLSHGVERQACRSAYKFCPNPGLPRFISSRKHDTKKDDLTAQV